MNQKEILRTHSLRIEDSLYSWYEAEAINEDRAKNYVIARALKEYKEIKTKERESANAQ